MRIVLLVFGSFKLSSSPAAEEEKLRTSTMRVCRNRGNVSSSRRVRWNHVTAQSIRGCAVKTKEGVQCRFFFDARGDGKKEDGAYFVQPPSAPHVSCMNS